MDLSWKDCVLTVGRLEVIWQPGSWRHLDEWVFARQGCDEGCLVYDVGFVCLTWKRGRHVDGLGEALPQDVTRTMDRN